MLRIGERIIRIEVMMVKIGIEEKNIENEGKNYERI